MARRFAFFLTLVVVCLGLAHVPVASAEGMKFQADLGIAYDVWFEELYINDEPPSGAEGVLGLGFIIDETFSISTRFGFHGYRQKIAGTEVELRNVYVEGMGLWHILKAENHIVRPYLGGGFTVMSVNYKQNAPRELGGDIKQEGTGFGIHARFGLEIGGPRHMGFLEAGYRVLIAEPLEFSDAGDYNNMPLIAGYRLRL